MRSSRVRPARLGRMTSMSGLHRPTYPRKLEVFLEGSHSLRHCFFDDT